MPALIRSLMTEMLVARRCRAETSAGPERLIDMKATPLTRRLAATSLAAAVLGGTVGCSPNDGSSPSVGPSATRPSPSETRVPASPDPGSAVTVDWTTAQLPALLSLEDGQAAASGPTGLLIIGTSTDGSDLVAATSADGRAWTATRLDTGALGGKVPLQVAGVSDGFIAFVGAPGPTAYASPDGIAWTARGELPSLINVAWLADWGTVLVACGQIDAGWNACVRSPDRGSTWLAPGEPPGRGGEDRVEAITATAEGLVVLTLAPDGGRIWRSTDGDRWTDEPAEGLDHIASWAVGGLVPGVDGLVMGGTWMRADRRGGDQAVGRIWAFQEGRGWMRLTPPDDVGTSIGIAEAGGRLVASARRLHGQSVEQAGAWLSPDGRRWTSVAWEPSQWVRSGPLEVPGGFVVIDDEAVHVATWRATGESWPETLEPAPSPSPVPSPPDELRGAAIQWTGPVSLADAMDVVAVGDAFLVGGSDGANGPAVWRAGDPIVGSWEPVALPRKIPDDSSSHTWTGVTALAASGDLVVAAGRRRVADREGQQAVFWRSADGGATWEVLPEAIGDDLGGQQVEGPEVGVRDVAAGSREVRGFVAVGSTSQRSVAWTSADGLAWRRSEVFENDDIRAVTSTGSGWVAVGKGGSWFNPRAAVWRSRDGLAWTLVDVDAPALSEVTWNPAMERLIAVGDGPGVLVSSDDGASWQWVPDQPDLLARGADGWAATMRGVVALDKGGFVAVGERGCRDSFGTCLVAWTSTEGRRWSSQDPPDSSGPTRARTAALAIADGIVVAVGVTGDAGAVWVGRVASPTR